MAPLVPLHSAFQVTQLTFKVVVLLSGLSFPSFSLLLFFLEVERSLSLLSLFVSLSLFFSFLFLFKKFFTQISI